LDFSIYLVHPKIVIIVDSVQVLFKG